MNMRRLLPLLLFVWSARIGVFGQVPPALGRASDAGQRVFDQRIDAKENFLFDLQATVTDRAGTPLQGARIVLKSPDGFVQAGMTDSLGHCNFLEEHGERCILPNTVYSIEVNLIGYFTLPDQIDTHGIHEDTSFIKEYYLTPGGPCFGHPDD